MRRTIASLALLNALWEARHHDYLDCLLPFLATLIADKRYKEITVEELCRDFQEKYELVLPYAPMTALINRARKKGIVIRQEHRFLADLEKASKLSIAPASLRHQQLYTQILDSIVAFAHERLKYEMTADQAGTALIAFLRQHDAEILFAATGRASLPDVTPSRKDQYVVCRFIQHVAAHDHNAFKAVVDVAAGHLIANALVYADIRRYMTKLTKTAIYLDTRFILRLAGTEGEFRGQSYSDIASLMRRAGASLFVFEHNYDEITRILHQCQKWIANSRYDPTRAGPTLRYFVEQGFTETDVDRLLVNLPALLEAHEISIVPSPDPNQYKPYWCDERTLESKIKAHYEGYNYQFLDWRKERVLANDVKSLASVLALRRGRKPASIRECAHLFVTTNPALAGACHEYERQDTDGDHVCACLTDVFVGTCLWAQSPGVFRGVIANTLMANCYAALQPDQELLEKFIKTCQHLYHEGKITSDEFYLLRSHRLSLSMLQDHTMGDPESFVDRLPEEILQQVKTEARKSAEAERDKEMAAHRETARELACALAANAAHEQAIGRVAGTVAVMVSWGTVALLAIASVGGVIVSWKLEWLAHWWCFLVYVVYTAFGLASTAIGVNCRDIRTKLASWLEAKTRNTLTRFFGRGEFR